MHRRLSETTESGASQWSGVAPDTSKGPFLGPSCISKSLIVTSDTAASSCPPQGSGCASGCSRFPDGHLGATVSSGRAGHRSVKVEGRGAGTEAAHSASFTKRVNPVGSAVPGVVSVPPISFRSSCASRARGADSESTEGPKARTAGRPNRSFPDDLAEPLQQGGLGGMDLIEGTDEHCIERRAAAMTSDCRQADQAAVPASLQTVGVGEADFHGPDEGMAVGAVLIVIGKALAGPAMSPSPSAGRGAQTTRADRALRRTPR